MADGCNHFSFSGASGNFKMSPSLPGPPGPPGKSAYEAAVDGGYTGTEAEFNAALAEVDTALQPSDVDAALSDSSTNPVQNKVVKSALDNKAPVITDTASGSVASFPDGADNLPVKSLVVQIEPVQAAGTPTPESPLPISGWTGCNISHSGEDTSSPTVIPVTLPLEAGTVYGGVLDVTHGVLTVTYGRAEMRTFIWALQDVDHVFRCNLSVREYGSDSEGIYGLCDSYAFWGNGSLSVVKNNLQNGQFGFQSTNSGVFVRNDSCMTVEDLRAALTDVYLVYPLAEPRTYQLTPTEVTTLLGQNNIWADTGDSTVEYPADTKLYIQKINAPSDDDMTADTQIASGKYFIIGGTLYLSTTTIPAGDTIIPGTNCVQTNLAEALNALNA